MVIDFEKIGSGGGGGYVLPVATNSTLGGVKIGGGLSIDSGGTLSVSGGSAGGGDYMVVNALSDITTPKEGMIAYVPAHNENFSGYVFDNSVQDISYQVRITKTAPRNIDYTFGSKYSISIDNGTFYFDSGNWTPIFRNSVWLKYDDPNNLTYVILSNDYDISNSLDPSAYETITTSFTVDARTYIYKNNEWLLFEDGTVSFYVNNINTQEKWADFISYVSAADGGSFQLIYDYYNYGVYTYKFRTIFPWSNNRTIGTSYNFTTPNGTNWTLEGLSFEITDSSGWKAYEFAKYDFLNPPQP